MGRGMATRIFIHFPQLTWRGEETRLLQQNERRFAIKWGLYATHSSGVIVRGRTYHVGATGFVFQPQIRYKLGDVAEMDVYFNPTESIHCTGQIVSAKPPYQVRIMRFAADGREKWQAQLLIMLRENKQKADAKAAEAARKAANPAP